MEITTKTWSPAYAVLPVRPLLPEVCLGTGSDVRPAGGTTIAFTSFGNGGAMSSDERTFDAHQGLSTWGPPV
ncbi:hypothetical protein [Solicola sp. PLA-1-18]|uniref:hypothetical protein n=1 Tax=Solicola sp. PLA-1-18 TaxID=3380532 RepID=UPI003B779C36